MSSFIRVGTPGGNHHGWRGNREAEREHRESLPRGDAEWSSTPSKTAAKDRAVRDAKRTALNACNYACGGCGRSYRKDSVRTKCYVICREPVDIAVLCSDCRRASEAKSRGCGP